MTLSRRNAWSLFDDINRMFPALTDDDSRVIGSNYPMANRRPWSAPSMPDQAAWRYGPSWADGESSRSCRTIPCPVSAERLRGLALLMLMSVGLSAPALAEKASRAEIISRSQDAAALILEKGEDAAYREINDPQAKFTWKGTYVYAIDLEGNMLARSFRTEKTVGKNFFNWQDKSNPPKYPIREMIEVAKTRGEGWVEYMYPKPGGDYAISFKKIGYVYKVPGRAIFVGAGIYE